MLNQLLNNFFVSGIIQGGFMRSLERTLGYGRGLMLLEGMWMTIRISLGAVFLGLIIGSIIVTFKLSKFWPLKAIAFVYLGVIRGTPSVTQILLVNAIIFAGIRGAGMWVGIVALGINSGAYVAEIIRAGIQSIDKGQREAGLSIGFTPFQTMRYIIMPQAVKNIIPTFVNEFIVLIKETAIVGFVAVADLTRVAQHMTTRTFDIMPILVSAVMYLVLISVLTALLSIFEKKLRASDKDATKKPKRRAAFGKI
ncbi:MAG: amino acid ABC transporter permease [Defluviitaleaceae bacterium]|nr:amino acid ABC transporter permease [Defluviitaleaceae bacterium]